MVKINDFVGISLSFQGYVSQKLIAFTNNVIKKLTDNPIFAPCATSVTELTALLSVYSGLLSTKSENKELHEFNLNEALVALLWKLRQTKGMLEFITNGNEGLVLSTGYEPLNSGDRLPITFLDTPVGFSVYYPFRKPGFIGVYCDPVPHAAFYEIETREKEDGEAILLDPQTSSSAFFDSFTPGKLMFFRMRACASRNVRSNWTEWVAILIPLPPNQSTPPPNRKRG